jgi:hypothetical protein
MLFDSSRTPVWQRVVPEDVPGWLEDAESLGKRADATPYLEQNLRYLLPWTRAEGHAAWVYELRDAGLLAYAAFDVGPATLDVLIGEVALHRHKIERARLSHWAVAANGDASPAAMAQLLERFNRDRPEAIVYLQGFPSGAATDELLAHPTVRRRFFTLRYGRPRQHYAIDLPTTMADFFAGLQKDLRGDLKRVIRQLDKRCEGDWELVTCKAPDDVARFLNEAVPVSELTFQYRLVNAGLSDRPKLERQFDLLAEAVIWRGHLLRCKGDTVAFTVGYQLGDTYYFSETGYDPKWAPAAVGKILLVEILKELIEQGAVRRFDFLFGDQDYKRRLANRSWVDCEYYLLPRSLRNWLLFVGISATRRGSEVAGRVLDRGGLKSAVRTFIRRRTKAGSPRAEP